MGFIKIKKQTWSCLFFHLGSFPGLGVVGNKFGTKHGLLCLHSASTCTECTRASSPGSSRSEPHRNDWAPEGCPVSHVPLRPLFPLILPIFPPVLPILSLSLCFTFFLTVLSCHSSPLTKWSHCLMPPCFIPGAELGLLVAVVTADVDRSPESLLNQTQAPAPLDWRGLHHLERRDPEPWGALSLGTLLICCEQGIMDIPQGQGEKCWRVWWCLPETEACKLIHSEGEQCWDTFSLGISVFSFPPALEQTVPLVTAGAGKGAGWAGAIVCFYHKPWKVSLAVSLERDARK